MSVLAGALLLLGSIPRVRRLGLRPTRVGTGDLHAQALEDMTLTEHTEDEHER